MSGILVNIIDKLLIKLEELYHDNEHLQEQLKDLESDIENNYCRVSVAEQCAVSDRDFA